MININTLNELENLNIGCDIDKLESYVALINNAEIMGNKIVREEEKERYIKLLKELKPTSEVLKYDWDMEVEPDDKYDEIFNKTGFYGKTGIKLDDNINELKESEDIIAYALPDGIDIRIIYVNGLLYQAYTYNREKKGKEITEYINEIIPYNIKEIIDDGIIDVRARLSINDNNLSKLGIKESDKLAYIVDYITHEYNEDLQDYFIVKVYKVFSNIDLKCNSLWEEYELLGNTDFDIVEYAIVREVYKEDIIDTINQLENHFLSLNDKEYNYTDISIVINNNSDKVIHNISEKNKEPKKLVATIIGIKWINSGYSITPRLEIKPIRLGDKTINYIDLNNLTYLEKNNISIGSKISIKIDYLNNLII